jgi:hypothetical protein
VVQQLAEVVDGAEQLDLGVGGVAAAVVQVAAEPAEELGEGGFDEGGATLVQALAGRGASRAAICSQPSGMASVRPVWAASPETATSSIRCSRSLKF